MVVENVNRRDVVAGARGDSPPVGVFVCVCFWGVPRGDLRGAALAFSALAVAASPASRLILAASKRMGEAPVGASAEAFTLFSEAFTRAFPLFSKASMSQHPGPHGG